MRYLIIALALACAASMIGTPQAHADPYRWCAVYANGLGSNCGFITWEQCRATIMSMGGFCELNQFYDGQPYDQAEPRRKRK